MATSTLKQPIGITLPIVHGPSGYFNQSYDILEQISNNLGMLLNTRRGERRMNLDFGSSLWDVLFEFNDTNLQPIVEDAVRRDVEKWLPYIQIKNVQVSNTDEQRDSYGVKISVTFTANSLGITSQQTVNIIAQQGNT